ncbi:GntG family PLP-dependent aldolase [Falsiroseomonas oryzae]|uniref:GntG family PLP-dependent aldolase n=1 Tax=Falsiroseomonas oryzae TaxID=2766473 RepID=UPI0022EB6DF6|nr:GntG family PLP-dependent aldolase [Roseomonas sp. MO-31]
MDGAAEACVVTARTPDFRSDTVTRPTPAMRAAMAAAEVGDDGYADDPTVNALQRRAARLLGKEAALFVPSGTMGNLCALLALTGRGEEVLLESSSHIIRSEMGGIAAVAGLAWRALAGQRGAIPIAAIDAVFAGGAHAVARLRPSLLCLETTHNAAGGAVLPLPYLAEARAAAQRHGMALHIDGARLFNAAVALGVPAEAIARHADTVTFCLSKGLGAPVGALLCGPAPFIERGRLFRRMLGGAMRQSGVLAAAGLVALDGIAERLAADHRRARDLATGLAAIHPGLCDPAAVETNIVMLDFTPSGRDAAEWARLLGVRGITCRATDAARMRLVTHGDLGDGDIAVLVDAVRALW